MAARDGHSFGGASVGPRPNRFPKIAQRFSALVAEFEGYTAHQLNHILVGLIFSPGGPRANRVIRQVIRGLMEIESRLLSLPLSPEGSCLPGGHGYLDQGVVGWAIMLGSAQTFLTSHKRLYPDSLVNIVNVQWFGSEALELTYRRTVARRPGWQPCHGEAAALCWAQDEAGSAQFCAAPRRGRSYTGGLRLGLLHLSGRA
jgi:hypothetical protein